MMATVSTHLHAQSTHLVADTVLSPKFRVRPLSSLSSPLPYLLILTPYPQAAAERSIPIVSPAWIIDSWKRGAMQPPERYSLKPLAGLIICLTGIEGLETRQELSRQIEALGATYSGDLTETCTHLLCNPAKLKPDPASKYYWAKQWKIRCVTPEWLAQVAQENRPLPSTSSPCPHPLLRLCERAGL